MSKHVSRPYTPSIANVYYLTGLIGSWGCGIKKIGQTCKEDGSPYQKIQLIASEDRITHTSLDKVTEKVTEAEQKLLSLLLEDPDCIYAVLAEMLGVSCKTIF